MRRRINISLMILIIALFAVSDVWAGEKGANFKDVFGVPETAQASNEGSSNAGISTAILGILFLSSLILAITGKKYRDFVCRLELDIKSDEQKLENLIKTPYEVRTDSLDNLLGEIKAAEDALEKLHLPDKSPADSIVRL